MEKITFSFGKNWKDFLKTVDDIAINAATEDIKSWLSDITSFKDKTILDIGSGSGIHSLSFYRLGAKEIISFDYDIHSVEATKFLWEKEGKPNNWKIMQGSILDQAFIKNLPKVDIVYSWGVLHHTGKMWEALENSTNFLKKGSHWFISLYAKGSLYQEHLALKQKYNKATFFGKKWMEFKYYIYPIMKDRYHNKQNPFKWNQRQGIRGMNVYHDIVDWLGGLPYEVASAEEVAKFTEKKDMLLKKIEPRQEGGCSVYLYLQQ